MGTRNRQGVGVEVLESRVLLAAAPPGAVTAKVVGGRLVVTGDNAQNVVRLDGLDLAAGQVRVSGLDVSTVNGHYRSVVFEDVTRGVRVELGRGDDILVVASLNVPGELGLFAGRGNDSVHLDTVWTGGAATVLGGAGDDQLDVYRQSAGRNLSLDAGDGADQVTVASSLFRRGVSLRTSGAGDDVMWASDCRFAGHFSARTAGGADDLSLGSSTFASDVSVETGGGDDTIFLGGSTFARTPQLDGEEGRDVVEREGISKSFDFREGALGWRAGFSNYNSRDHDIAALTSSGPRALPPDLGLDATGFLLSGLNVSDDLLMFLNRSLGVTDGVRPNQKYGVTIELSLASNAPTGSIGAGGPPGEGVGIAGGAQSAEPATSIDPDGYVRLALADGTLGFGNIANGTPPLSDTRVRVPYLSLTRTRVLTGSVRANSSGDLWVVVGTQSGFEGTTTLYYQRIEVRLIPIAE